MQNSVMLSMVLSTIYTRYVVRCRAVLFPTFHASEHQHSVSTTDSNPPLRCSSNCRFLSPGLIHQGSMHLWSSTLWLRHTWTSPILFFASSMSDSTVRQHFPMLGPLPRIDCCAHPAYLRVNVHFNTALMPMRLPFAEHLAS